MLIEGNRPDIGTVLRERRLDLNSAPGKRPDRYTVGLVIQGGGTKAAVIAGMAEELLRQGFGRVFDRVYGASSGGYVGAYYIAQQQEARIFCEDIATTRFYDPRRIYSPEFIREILMDQPGTSRPVVDSAHLAYDITMASRPLNTAPIIEGSVPLNLYVSDAQTAQILRFNDYESQEQIHDILHWSSRVPVWSGMPMRVGKQRLGDGAILAGALPLEDAMAECDYILALLIRPEGSWHRQIDPLDRRIPAILRRNLPLFASHYFDGYIRYDRAMTIIERAKSGLVDGVCIDSIAPPEGTREWRIIHTDGKVQKREVGIGMHLARDKIREYGIAA